MTKRRPRPQRAVDAAREALARESAKRSGELKPIEIVKIVICAYQKHMNVEERALEAAVESADRSGLRRGTQASVDRLLFNANYWLAAYEDRIVAACAPEDARMLLEAVTVWSTHTLKLNTLGDDEAIAAFERFCPPFTTNKRRGSPKGGGKGPLPEFEARVADALARHPEASEALLSIVADMRSEAAAYAGLPAASPLDALFAILPAWCLQEKIPLVSGEWWDDIDVMGFLAGELKRRFAELGHGEAPCQYFHDSFLESIDAYQRDVSPDPSAFAELPISELLAIVHAAREAQPAFEADGYGDELPAWLVAKEQLIWNTVVCALYGPESARPLLVASPQMFAHKGREGRARKDVITELARVSFERYRLDRMGFDEGRAFSDFDEQTHDLRASGIEHIKSLPAKLEILGYEIVPEGSCYPDQRVEALSMSEVECLAVLEHRRWLAERIAAGWAYGKRRDVEAKISPYLVPWEELPDRAREWNRSAIRNIPALLEAEHLAIARK